MEEKLIQLAGADGFFSSGPGLMIPDRREYFFLENVCICTGTGFCQVT